MSACGNWRKKDKCLIDHNKLDSFIELALSKFEYKDPHPDLYKATGSHAYFIIHNNCLVPDLVIFNQTFNKNFCYYDFKSNAFNPFPRKKFLIEKKNKNENNISAGSFEEDPQWMNVEINELDVNGELKFESLPREDKREFKDESIIKESRKSSDSKLQETFDFNYNLNQLKDEENDEKSKEYKDRKNSNEEFNLYSNLKGTKGFEETKSVKSSHEDAQFNMEIFDHNTSNLLDNNEFGFNMNLFNENEEYKELRELKELKDNSFEKDDSNSTKININKLFEKDSDTQEEKEDKKSEGKKYYVNNNYTNIQINMPPTYNFPPPYMNFVKMNLSGGMPPMQPIHPIHSIHQQINKGKDKKDDKKLFVNNMQNQMFLPNLQYNPQLHNMLVLMQQQAAQLGQNKDIKTQLESQYIENPSQVILKNMIDKGWFVSTEKEKLMNFNSIELLDFLEVYYKFDKKYEIYNIQDYQSDMYFTPMTLLENLREIVPAFKAKMQYQKNMMNRGVSINNLNMMNNIDIMKVGMMRGMSQPTNIEKENLSINSKEIKENPMVPQISNEKRDSNTSSGKSFTINNIKIEEDKRKKIKVMPISQKNKNN